MEITQNCFTQRGNRELQINKMQYYSISQNSIIIHLIKRKKNVLINYKDRHKTHLSLGSRVGVSRVARAGYANARALRSRDTFTANINRICLSGTQITALNPVEISPQNLTRCNARLDARIRQGSYLHSAQQIHTEHTYTYIRTLPHTNNG